jgi:hypothetical protein
MLGMDKRPPFTVIAYVAIVETALVAALIDDGADPRIVSGGRFLIVASFGLWRGVWFAWLILTVFEAGNLLVVLVDRPVWWAVLLKTIMVALLISAPTRLHARRRRRGPPVTA